MSTEGKIKKYSNKQNEPLFQNEIAFVLSDVPNGRAIAKTFLVDKSSKYTLNQRIAGITPHSNINPKFLSITMNRNKYFLQFDDGVKQTNLSLNDMKKFEEFYPKKQEQDKIGELFTNLDNLITLHHRKYTYIFYSWEQRKLGEIGYAKSGQGFPDAEQGGTKGIPFYKVSDMNIAGNENELITANNYVTLEQINKNHWNIINDVPAIFFAKVGAAVMLNRKRLCRNSFLLDNNTMAYMFDKSKWNYNFGKTLFDTIDLTLLAQIGAIPSYNASDVENIEILMPHLKEQDKIGELFTNLDNLITLHQHKELKRRNDNNEHLRW